MPQTNLATIVLALGSQPFRFLMQPPLQAVRGRAAAIAEDPAKLLGPRLREFDPTGDSKMIVP